MDKLSEMFRKAKISLAEFVQTSFVLIIIVQISIVAIPYLKDAIKANNLPASMTNWLFVLHMLLGGLSIFATLKIKSFVQASNIVKIEEAFQEMESDSSNQKEIIGKFYRFSYCNLWALQFLESLKVESTCDRDDFSEIGTLIDPLVNYRSEVFGFIGSEFYNIAVYLYNTELDQLEPYFRRCDDRIMRHNRSWTPPFGFVGYTYWAKDVTIMSEYPNQPSATTGNEIETDKKYYASCIVSPIPGNGGDGKPIGVLLISSSRTNHFSQNNTELRDFIREFSLILSQYFANYWQKR